MALSTKLYFEYIFKESNCFFENIQFAFAGAALAINNGNFADDKVIFGSRVNDFREHNIAVRMEMVFNFLPYRSPEDAVVVAGVFHFYSEDNFYQELPYEAGDFVQKWLAFKTGSGHIARPDNEIRLATV